MFIPDPGSWFLPIPDPRSKTAAKERGEQKFVVIPFFVFWNNEEKNLSQFSKNYIIELFTKKIVTMLSTIWVWDPGSGKNLFPDPRSRGQKSTRSRIPDSESATLLKTSFLPTEGRPNRRAPFLSLLTAGRVDGSGRMWCSVRKCTANSLRLSCPSPHSVHRIGPSALIRSRKLVFISGWIKLNRDYFRWIKRIFSLKSQKSIHILEQLIPRRVRYISPCSSFNH